MAMQKHFCMRGLSFLLALTLVFGLITPMTMTAHAAENSNVPSNVTVQYSNATDFRGTYYSNNLESKVNIRTIRTSYNYGGEAVNSYGFCLDKGLGLSSNDTYTYASEFASYPAAPFIAFMLSGARYNNWDNTTLQSVQGWVNAVIWLTEAGLFTDPLDSEQITMAAEERVAALSAVFAGEHMLQASIDLLNIIVDGYNQGHYGDWNFYKYDTNNSANQNLLIAEQTLEEDEHYAYLQLNKTGEAGAGLGGAVFSIYENGTLRGEIVTDSSGHGISDAIRISDETATLTVVETKAPAGYIASGKTYTVSVSAEANSTAGTAAWVNNGSAITNTKIVIPTEYVILKTDKATGEPLSGATFRLEHVTSNLTYDLVTNEDGAIELQWLDSTEENYIAPGTYTIIETAPPVGYALGNHEVETITFERLPVYDDDGDFSHWEQNDVGQFIFENPKKNTIQFTKIDEDGDIINGGTFEIYRDGTLIATKTAGSIILDDLETGYYTFKEIAAPSGYVASSNPYASVYVNVEDTSIDTYYLSMINHEYPDIQIRKTAPDGQGLGGAIFDIEIDGTSVGQVTTNSIGVATISYDTYGAFLSNSNNSWTLTATEVQAPTGHLLAPNSAVTVEIQRGQSLATLEFINNPIPELEIMKLDAATGLPLAGATFDVYIDGVSIGSYVSDANGIVTLDYSDYGDRLDLTADSWVIKVTEIAAPSGYDLSDVTTKEVVVTSGQNSVPFVFANYEYPEIEIIKTDANGNKPLAGALMKVSINAQTIGFYTTGSDGKVIISYADYYEFLGVTTDNEWTVQVEELRAPNGYLLNDDNVQTAVLYRNQGKVSFAFSNYDAPVIRILKLDSSNGNAPLAGATFEVRIDTASLGSFVTNSEGEIIITYDEYGAYLDQSKTSWTVTATELSAPDGYLMSDIRTLSNELILGQKLSTFVFNNAEYPAIVVEKRCSVTNALLAGATFDVTIDGTHIGSWTTDENGQFTITHAEYGSYIENSDNNGWTVQVTETTPPDGYHNATVPTQQAQMIYGQSLTPFVFVNVPKSTLVVTKVDSVDKTPLEGVTFEISRDTTSIGKFKTDKNGEIHVAGLASGTYTVTEVATISGYILNSAPQTVEISADDNIFEYKLHFENDRQPTLTINKVDSVTGDPILGAKFEITYQSSKTTTGEIRNLGTFYTDKNGQIHLPALDAGWYTATELEPADGYSLAEPLVQELYLGGNENAEMTFENIPLSALIIWKRDAEDSSIVLAGAEFEVSYLNGNSGTGGTVIGRYTTSANGSVTVTGLKAGTYIIEEVVAPAGYELNSTTQTVYIAGDEQSVVTVDFRNYKVADLVIMKKDSVTGEMLSGAKFKVTYSDGTVVGNSNGYYTTDKNGIITIGGLDHNATVIVQEVTAPSGYHLDDTPQTIQLTHGEGYVLTFENDPMGGLQIIKKDAEDGDRIAGVKFEIRKMNGEIIGTYTTSSNGTIILHGLDDGWYTVTEIKAADGYILDDTPHNVEVKNGKTTTLTVENRQSSNILIRKVDADTGEGLYGAVFIVYDSKNNPIGEYTSDQRGYVYIDDIPDGRYKIREITAPEGYLLDDGYKTVTVRYGYSPEIKWENTAIRGQIQITKYAMDNNSITGATAGTALAGATYEISNYRSGTVVGYITSDSRGIAASEPLPLGRYTVKEVSAPAYYQLSSEIYDVTLEYEGQILKLAVYNSSVTLDTHITKTGITEVLAGSTMAYNFTVANTSNVALENFFWHDRIPTDVTTATTLTTGTYNQWGYYQILYKTNCNDYRVLASNLLTTNNYSFALNTIPLMSGEVVTDIYFDFGTVPAGFQSVTQPTLSVSVNPSTPTGYNIINRADCGGQYESVWITKEANWVTIVRNLGITITLPKTGY